MDKKVGKRVKKIKKVVGRRGGGPCDRGVAASERAASAVRDGATGRIRGRSIVKLVDVARRRWPVQCFYEDNSC